MNSSHSSPLPINRNLQRSYFTSWIVAALMAIISVIGLFFSTVIYPTEDLAIAFIANDVVNLGIGLPVLILSMWLTSRRQLIGLLLWPGALLYVSYNYIAYLFGIPLGIVSLVFLVLILLSAFSMLSVLTSVDRKFVQGKLTGAVPEKIIAWVLILFGVLFILRATSMFADAASHQVMLPMTEIGVLLADVFVSIIWVAGGVLLLRRQPWGLTSALGLLFGASMLFVGLIAFLLLQPTLTTEPFAPVDVVVVFVMGLVCFIPTGLFIRGVVSGIKPESDSRL